MNKAMNEAGQSRERPLVAGLLVVGGWIWLVVAVGLGMTVRMLIELLA